MSDSAWPKATDHGDEGRAILETIFIGVLLLIPIVYILIAVLRVQAGLLAVSQAARDAGRAMDAAPSAAVGVDRARAIAAIALRDQYISAEGMTVKFVEAGAGCSALEIAPSVEPGSSYDVCVIAVLQIPGVPTALAGSRNTATGVYTVRVGELREGR